jgi:hypothetical protein
MKWLAIAIAIENNENALNDDWWHGTSSSRVRIGYLVMADDKYYHARGWIKLSIKSETYY